MRRAVIACGAALALIGGQADGGRPSRGWDAAHWQVGGSDVVGRIIADQDLPPVAPGDWWQIAGATLPTALYDPQSAASLSGSYANVVAPGTLDLPSSQAAPPTWSTAGWAFAGAHRLTTTITPVGTPALLVAARGLPTTTGTAQVLAGQYATSASRSRLYARHTTLKPFADYGAAATAEAPAYAAARVLGMAPGYLWADSTRVAGLAASVATGAAVLWIGNTNGGTSAPLGTAGAPVTICSVAYWASDPGIATLSAYASAMGARCQ